MELAKELWECRICSSGSLPGRYSCCPNCSHERDWDGPVQVASSDPERFTGRTYSCCGLGWKASARFCGLCGDPLRQRRTLFGRRPSVSRPPMESLGRQDHGGPTLIPFLGLQWILDDEVEQG